CRHARVLTSKPGVTVGFSLLMSICFVVGIQWLSERVRADAISPAQMEYLQVRNNLPSLYQAGCDEWFSSARVVGCSYGDENAENTAVMIADSIGAQWLSAIGIPFVESGWRFIVYTKSACPIVSEPVYYARIGMMYEVCSRWRQDALTAIQSISPNLI